MKQLILALFALGFVGCDTLECGEGTHRSGDLCVSTVQVRCGEGTAFLQGRCISIVEETDAGPDMSIWDAGSPVVECGKGTHLEVNTCVPDVVTGDLGVDLPDAEIDQAVDMEPPAPRCPGDLEPAAAPPLDCGVLEPGQYCVTGVARDFLTGCALPADEGLVLLVIDPAAAAAGLPIEQYTRGVGFVGPHGAFAIGAAGESSQLALVIDEGPEADGDRWTRSVSGISAAQPTPNQIFPIAAFATTNDTQAVWNQALGLGDGALAASGFMVGRVFDIGATGLVPKAGAAVRARQADLIACNPDAPCLRFFDDDPRLTGFQAEGAGTTGASGGFLMILRGVPVYQDAFIVEGDAAYAPVPAGASQGSGFHTAFVPTAR